MNKDLVNTKYFKARDELMETYPFITGVGRSASGIVVYINTATEAKIVPEFFGGFNITFKILGDINALR